MPNIIKQKTKYKKRYKCPYCEVRLEREKLPDHIDKQHAEMIPEGWTATRIAFNTVNKKETGYCVICHGETKWNEDKQRYERICENPKCNKEYLKLVETRLMNARNQTKQQMLSDPEFQNKMLRNRKISGSYKFTDGGKVDYVGSYEKKFLEFMDKFLHVLSKDIQSPGPTIEYYYEGKKHFWITDYYYAPYNLVLDVKDGGSNPNNREMVSYRAKQIAKEKAIESEGKYNYLRLTDNQFSQLIEMMIELKESLIEYDRDFTGEAMRMKPIVKIYEDAVQEGFGRNITMALRINPKLSMEEIYKGHKYPGLLNYAKSCKRIDDLQYLKRDTNTLRRTHAIIIERIDKCEKLGNCKETKAYYKGIKKTYIVKGITSRDVQLYDQWLEKEFFPAVNDRIKELRKAQHEFAIYENHNSLDNLITMQNELVNYDYGVIIGNTKLSGDEVDFREYRTLSASKFKKYRCGVCWDFAKYQEKYLKKYYKDVQNYYFVVELAPNYPTHTITTVKIDGEYYYSEASWLSHQGIYKAKNINDIINMMKRRLLDFENAPKNTPVYVFKYTDNDKLVDMSPIEYMTWMEKHGTEIKIPYDKNAERKVEKLEIISKESLLEQEYHINDPRGYYVIDKEKLEYPSFDTDISYPTIGQCILDDTESGDYYVYAIVLDKWECIGKIHISIDKKDEGAAFWWTETYGDNTSPLNEEAIMESPVNIYHISYENHDGKIFEPRYYDNDNVKNDMERRVKRICFSDSIQGCLYSIFANGGKDADFYVHVPATQVKMYKTTTDDIYDSNITHEIWVKEPVEMRCIGKIHVSGFTDKTKTIDVSDYDLGYNKKEYRESKWKWVEKYVKDDSLLINEAMLINKKDIYYNKDKFDSGEINLCFITGHSGSGKSTMAHGMEKNEIETYELDDVQSNKIHFTLENLKEYGDLIYSFFTGTGKKYYYTKEDIESGTTKEISNYDEKLMRDFVDYAINYTKSHKNKKFVIEGIWLFLYIEPQKLKNYAVYIKGTSRLISDIRAAKRDSKEEFPDDCLKRTKAYFGRAKNFFTKEAKTSEAKINKYRKYFGNLQEKSLNESLTTLESIDTVIFDLGSVLINDNFEELLYQDQSIPNEYVPVLKDTWISASDKISETDTKEMQIRKVTEALPIELRKYIPFVERIATASYTPYEYTESLLSSLKLAGYKLYYLSNWGKWHCEELQKNGKMDFLKYFDGGVFSYKVGCKKPDSRIYNIFLDKTGIDPTTAIFFDDRLENVQAAREHQIRAEVFVPEIVPTLKQNLLANSIIESADHCPDIQQRIRKPSNISPSQDGFINKEKGTWNSIIKYKNEILRERVECIIFNKNRTKILIGYTEKESSIPGRTKVRLPGGGTEKDLSLEEQLVNECHEEIFVNITDIEYVDTYIRIQGKRPHNKYTGSYNHLFVATYDGRYTGHVNAVDRDSLAKQVRWYSLDKGIEMLKMYNEKIYEIMKNYLQ